MKLAAIVVLFNPNMNEIEKNISSYANDVDLLIIWDNSPTPQSLQSIKFSYPNAIISQEKKNIGLSAAYNNGITIAKKHQCTHIMTMDQDSTFENFPVYKKAVENLQLEGISCTAINDDCITCTTETSNIGYSCQSGSIYPLDMIEQIGHFREDLFIGMVDAEISLRAAEYGYTITRFNKCALIHQIGSGRKVSFFGRTINISDYNALRYFYDSRNRILLWHQFPYDYNSKSKIRHLIGRIKLISRIILFEQNKLSKTCAVIRGTIYGLANRNIAY